MEISELRKRFNDLIELRQKYEKIIVNRDVLLEGIYRQFYKTAEEKNVIVILVAKSMGLIKKLRLSGTGSRRYTLYPKTRFRK